MGPQNSSMVGDSSFRSREGLCCGLLLCGWELLSLQDFQGVDERGTSGRCHHLHGHSGLRA